MFGGTSAARSCSEPGSSRSATSSAVQPTVTVSEDDGARLPAGARHRLPAAVHHGTRATRTSWPAVAGGQRAARYNAAFHHLSLAAHIPVWEVISIAQDNGPDANGGHA